MYMRDGATRMAKPPSSLLPAASWARKVNGKKPLVVGVPLRVALVPLWPSTRPPGSAPPTTVQLTLPLAPRVAMVAEYGRPTRAGGSRAATISMPLFRATVSASCRSLEPPASLICTVKVNVPSSFGVPLTVTEVVLLAPSASPGGSAPATSFHAIAPPAALVPLMVPS